MDYLPIYLFIVNALGFLLMLVDKEKAKKNKWRIPESVLLGVTLLCGSAGTLLGMYAFRHKTKKPAFAWGVPFILLMQAVIILIYIQKSDIL